MLSWHHGWKRAPCESKNQSTGQKHCYYHSINHMPPSRGWWQQGIMKVNHKPTLCTATHNGCASALIPIHGEAHSANPVESESLSFYFHDSPRPLLHPSSSDWKKASRELGLTVALCAIDQVVAISLWYEANWNMKLTGASQRISKHK